MRLDLEESQWSLILALLSLVEDSSLLTESTRKRAKRLRIELEFKLENND